MSISIVLQKVSASADVPALSQLEKWVESTLTKVSAPLDTEITIRIVDEDESASLNEEYRHKKGPTNILSFPDDPIPGFDSTSLGDLVVCAPLVTKEAQDQNKTSEAHWAHLIVHGVLHLLGYDHVEDQEAEVMEALEIDILKTLGYGNPY